jgi:hypothetical protein
MPTSTVRVDDDLKTLVQAYAPAGSFSDALRELLRREHTNYDRSVQVMNDLKDAKTTISALQNVTTSRVPTSSASPVSFGVPEMTGGMTATYWTEFDSRMKKHTDSLLEQARRGY